MIGVLRHRFTLEKPVRTADGLGGFSVEWHAATVNPKMFGSLIAMRQTAVTAQLQQAVDSYFLSKVRYRDDMDLTMRLRLGSRIFEIRGLSDPDGRKKYLDLTLLERFP